VDRDRLRPAFLSFTDDVILEDIVSIDLLRSDGSVLSVGEPERA
jgi:hypothetical protein